jgi:uncharacterized protein with ParB-like and HNH nuclease domain
MPKFAGTTAVTVGEIFRQYETIMVPDYQRNYSWESNENSKNGCKICDMWNDLVEKYEDYLLDPTKSEEGEYLLGPMVFVDKNNGQPREIVDGQQRLATLTILFCAARDIILELDPDYPRSEMGQIYNIIENSKNVPGQGAKKEWVSWKLKLNQVDNKLFKKFIQTYEVKDPPYDEIKDKDSDKFYKNSKKITYFREQIKDHKSDYTESQILLFEAYIALSEKISDALILSFDSKLEKKARLDEISEQGEIEAEKKIRTDPKKYLGDELEDFFNNDKTGLDKFQDKSWSVEQKMKLEAELKKKNEHRVRDGKDEQSWSDFIDRKIKSMKTMNKGGMGSFQTVLDNEKEIEVTNSTKDEKEANIPKLVSFCIGIHDYITNVRIPVKEEEDAYQIFESLNDKGQSLSKSNLIKNWIIKTIDDEQEKKAQSTEWDYIISALEKNSIDVNKFLRVSLISRGYKPNSTSNWIFGQFPIANSSNLTKLTTNNFYRVVKAMIKNEDSAKKYIENLKEDSEIRIKLNSPRTLIPGVAQHLKEKHRDPKPALIDLDFLDAEYILIPILTAYRKWKVTSDEFILLVKVLVAFFFRYKIVSKLSPSNIEKIAFTACSVIQNGDQGNKKTDMYKIFKFVLQYDKPTYFENQFENRFDPPDATNTKFVLKHIESFMKKATDDTTPIEDVEIEHILPQNAKESDPDPKKIWKKDDFFKGYAQGVGGRPNDYSSWNKLLGNLTNLKGMTNKKISNFSYTTKLDHKNDLGQYDGYRSSSLRINEDTVVKDQETGLDRTEWTFDSIVKRGTHFKKLSTEIWQLPKIVCEDNSCSGHQENHYITAKTIEELDSIKCDKCDKDLIIGWMSNIGPEYQAPTEYEI